MWARHAHQGCSTAREQHWIGVRICVYETIYIEHHIQKHILEVWRSRLDTRSRHCTHAQSVAGTATETSLESTTKSHDASGLRKCITGLLKLKAQGPTPGGWSDSLCPHKIYIYIYMCTVHTKVKCCQTISDSVTTHEPSMRWTQAYGACCPSNYTEPWCTR